MSNVQRGTPPSGVTYRKNEVIASIVEAAVAEPGEWFFSPLEETGKTQSNAYTAAYRSIGMEFGEVRVLDGQLWVRIKPEDEK